MSLKNTVQIIHIQIENSVGIKYMLTIKVNVGEIDISFDRKPAAALSNDIYDDKRNTLTFVFQFKKINTGCFYIGKKTILCRVFMYTSDILEYSKMFVKSEEKSLVSRNCLSG